MIRVLLVGLLLGAVPCLAQPGDSTRPAGTGRPEHVDTKSPGLAVAWGIIPGGGQIYTEQYWKAPIIAGAAGFFLWRALDLNAKYNEQADIASALAPDDPQLSRVKQLREEYRDDRDMTIVYLLAVEALGMIDAYVGAYLFDFNVESVAGSAKLGVLPGSDGPVPSLSLKLQF